MNEGMGVGGWGLFSRAFEQRAAPFLAAGVLAAEDVYAVDAVAGRFGESDPEVLLGLAFAVRAPRAGHIGVDLTRVHEHIEVADGAALDLGWPTDRDSWQAKVGESPMVGTLDEAGRPFVAQPLHDRVLVLTRRMYDEQRRVAEALKRRAAQAVEMKPGLRGLEGLDGLEGLEARIADLFGDEREGEAASAVRIAARSRLALVTGGPGTGKTFSIKRLLALLIEGEQPERPLRIELAAPTGKAAVRMAEAMGEGLDELAVDKRVKERLMGLAPRTLHKLLGVRPDGSVRHHADRPVPADVIVVDEVSMVDLAMMRRLLDAVSPEARLVLLGDKDQLASVEAGSVLGDVVRAAGPDRPGGSQLGERVVKFTRSRRFESAPDIAAVAAGLQAGDEEGIGGALAILRGREHAHNEWLTEKTGGPRITHLGCPRSANEGVLASPEPYQRDLLAQPYCGEVHRDKGRVLRGYAALLGEQLHRHGAQAPQLSDPELHRTLLAALDHYRVLAVHRRGPLGVAGLERDLSERVRAHLTHQLGRPLPTASGHWLGRPILVTENAYEVGLMNGDVGLVLPGPAHRLMAAFLQSDTNMPVKYVALSRLPTHEGALAMTVHKSQGSQFDRVAVVLAGRESPIQTRELIYTAITRARSRVDWLGSEFELEAALHRTVVRTSGLTELLEA